VLPPVSEAPETLQRQDRNRRQEQLQTPHAQLEADNLERASVQAEAAQVQAANAQPAPASDQTEPHRTQPQETPVPLADPAAQQPTCNKL